MSLAIKHPDVFAKPLKELVDVETEVVTVIMRGLVGGVEMADISKMLEDVNFDLMDDDDDFATLQ